MEKIILESYYNKHEFELVDSVPLGYKIWNIGKNMIDGYLPLVQVGGYDGCQVNTRTMKAIKADGAQTILAAVVYGYYTVKEMEKRIDKIEGNAKKSTEVERMKKALPFMKKIRGL